MSRNDRHSRISEPLMNYSPSKPVAKQLVRSCVFVDGKQMPGVFYYHHVPSKKVRQAAFVEVVHVKGMSSVDAVKKASMFPDFERSDFKVLRMVA